MRYRIEFRPAARKSLGRIPAPFSARIAAAIDSLAEAPRPPGCVRLQGPDGFHRIRVGDYRIVYVVIDRVLVVCVVRIAHRKDVYRGL